MATESERIENEFDADLRTVVAQEASLQTAHCYPETDLRRLARRAFSGEKASVMMRHIAACGYCRPKYRQAEYVWGLVQAKPDAVIPAPPRAVRAPWFVSRPAVAVYASALTAVLVYQSMQVVTQQTLAASETRHRQELIQQQQQFAARNREFAARDRELAARNRALQETHTQDKQAVARLQQANTDVKKQAEAALADANQKRMIALNTVKKLQRQPPQYAALMPSSSGRAVLYRDERQKIETACSTGQITLPSAESEAYATRGSSTPAQEYPIQLVNPAPVTEVRPLLECASVPGATNYRVTIFDPTRPGEAVPTTLAVARTRWKMTGDLKRGRTYRWQVTAQREGKTIQSPAASFAVLPSQDAKRVAYMQRYYADAPLKRGVFYAQHGFASAAARAWSQIPEHPLAAHWLKALKQR